MFKLVILISLMNFKLLAFDESTKIGLCKSLIDANDTEKNIKDCFDSINVDYEQYKKKHQPTYDKKAKLTFQDFKKQGFYETATFNSSDLIFSGKKFFAVELDRSSKGKISEVLTPADELCKFKGYENATSAKLSNMLFDRGSSAEKEVHLKGWVLDSRLLGDITRVFENPDSRKRVMAYDEITCIKMAENKKAENKKPITAESKEERELYTLASSAIDHKFVDLEKLTEEAASRPTKSPMSSVDDSPRTKKKSIELPAKKTTPHGFDDQQE